MDNSNLKKLICRAANVEIEISSYKSGENCEGYVYAYPVGSGKVIGKKMRYPGVKAVAQGDSYGSRTKAQATHKALLRLAEALGVVVEDTTAVERANQADFDARTRF